MKNESNARLSNISLFAQIVFENYQKLLSLEPQRQSSKTRLSHSNIEGEEVANFTVIDEASKYAVTVIVFSAIVLEAYIYDYASRNFSDAFARAYLDKLDPISKWVIIPRLVTGKEWPRGRKWFSLLKDLIQERNKITHYKSSDFPVKFNDVVVKYQQLEHDTERMFQVALQAVDLFDLLAEEIAKNDSAEIPWIKAYFPVSLAN